MSELSKSQIIEIISTSKKYNNSNFIFDISNQNYGNSYVTYIIGERKYKISIDDNWKRLNMRYSAYGHNMKPIDVSFPKRNTDAKKILAKFREVIRNVIKVDAFLKIKEESMVKLTPVIENFIRKEFSLTGTFSIIPNITFPNTTYYVKNRGRGRSSSFDVSKEKPENLRFNVSVSLTQGKFKYDLVFAYLPISKKLILERKEESFDNYSKDITKIIRSEKLKNLIKNEEAIN